ncbi:MAG: restriction endonuclease subunit S [Lactobacillus helveticus]|uniref:restriction endonuclease subunit S n=1 Tax=Lactobacillus helveticus TaxID=1587 RepID=UPI001563DF26|nr:Type-1 restriction enzyme EcoKI specificity protein [Lactobacillus helveticus]
MKTNSLDFDAQALREKILDLAMRGKLVPQDPNDEPASVLLEKDNLKNSDEKPHDIPASWKWIILGSGVNFYNGRAYKKNELLNDDKFTPVLRVGNLFTNSSWYYSDLKLDPNKYIDNGDLIYAWSASFGPKIWNGGRVIFHYHIWKLKYDNTAIDKNFLYYFLLDKRNVVGETDLHGSTMKHITKTNMEHLPFPLPPLSEQSRIAAKIAQLFALLRKVETSTQQYAKLQTLLKSKVLDLAMRGKLVKQDPNDEPASVLLEKIKAEKQELIKEKKIKKTKPLPPITDDEKPFAIPDSWEWVRLGDLVAPVEYAMADGPFGSNLKKADYTDQPEVRIVQLSNIGENGWKDNNVKYTTFEHLKLIQRSEVFPGNIVIAKMMPAGRGILIPNKDKKYVLSSDAVKFIPNDLLNKQFLLDAINSNAYRNQVNQKLQGTTRPRTSLKKLKNFILPSPPLEEQERITREISKLLALALM